jgi:cupin fold WbuC family metalloprotein
MALIKESEEVYRNFDDIAFSSKDNVKVLEEGISEIEKKRRRICFHENGQAPLHEMHICLARETYVRPARHFNKPESLCVLSGCADLYLFSEKGELEVKVQLGTYESGCIYYYRMNAPLYHMLLVRSKIFVFQEVTAGPLDARDTQFADWSPREDSSPEIIKSFLGDVSVLNIGDSAIRKERNS